MIGRPAPDWGHGGASWGEASQGRGAVGSWGVQLGPRLGWLATIVRVIVTSHSGVPIPWLFIYIDTNKVIKQRDKPPGI